MEDKEIKIKSPDEVVLNESDYNQPSLATQVPANPAPAAPEPAQVSDVSEPQTPEKSKSKSRGIFIAVISLIVLTLGVGTTIAIINHNNTSEEAPKTSEQPIEKELEPISELRLTSSALSDFDLKFLQLEDRDVNKVYSPLSIKYALAMLKDGAAGDSKAQIENLIGSYVPKAYMNNEHRSLANALFVRDTYQEQILESYINNLQTKYAAEVISDPFNSATFINDWINEKTFGIIPSLVQDDVVRDKDFILTNALAIDMNWNNQIQCSANTGQNSVPCLRYSVRYQHEDYSDSVGVIGLKENGKPSYASIDFNGQENTSAVTIGASINNYDILKEIGEDKIREIITAEYTEWLNGEEAKAAESPEQDVAKFVNQYIEELGSNYGKVDFSTDFSMYDDAEVKVFAKDLQEYDGDTLQYVAVMPKEASLADYIKSIDAEKVSTLVGSLKKVALDSFKEGVVTKISGYIPLFHYNYELQLKKDLQELGVEDVFSPGKADLSNMTSAGAFIAEAMHVADVDFSNDGIKAAAVTIMAGLGAAGGPHYEHLWDVPVEEINLTFDKPFFFLIRDKASGEVWFAGTVYEPTVNE